MLLLIMLSGLIIASFCYAFSSVVASVGNTLTGNNKPAKPSRHEEKSMKLKELMDWADELEQQAKQLQRDTAHWRKLDS